MENFTAQDCVELGVQNDRTDGFPELSELMRKRAATYGFIARLYRVEVDEALLSELKALRFPAATGNSDVDEGYRMMASYLASTWENALVELAVDYVRSFIGHGNDAYSAAYPYESVYTSEKRLMMQEARDEVLAAYQEEGLGKAKAWHEEEDHLALELEFEQVLCCRAADALDEGNLDEAVALAAKQQTFLNEHLLSWVPMMTADLRRFAKTGLYQGLAYLTDGFLQTERELLDELLEDEEAAQ